MNNIVKNVIIFVAGGAVGAACGIFGTKKYYQNKYKKLADEKVASMEKYVEKIKKIYKKGLYSEALGYTVEKEPEKEKVEKTSIQSEEEGDVDYNNISMSKFRRTMNKLAEEEHPTEEDEKEEIYKESELLRQKELNESMKGEAYVISPEEDAIDAVSSREILYYLVEDDMMLDENEEIIPEYHGLVGDTIEDSGFRESEEEELYVKNPSLGVIFEVNKVYGGEDY